MTTLLTGEPWQDCCCSVGEYLSRRVFLYIAEYLGLVMLRPPVVGAPGGAGGGYDPLNNSAVVEGVSLLYIERGRVGTFWKMTFSFPLKSSTPMPLPFSSD